VLVCAVDKLAVSSIDNAKAVVFMEYLAVSAQLYPAEDILHKLLMDEFQELGGLPLWVVVEVVTEFHAI
jgi:hypothetical protein